MEKLELNEKTSEEKIFDMYKNTAACSNYQQQRYLNSYRPFSEQYGDDLFSLERYLKWLHQYKTINEENTLYYCQAIEELIANNSESYDSKRLAIIFDIFEKLIGFREWEYYKYGYSYEYYSAVEVKDFYPKFSPTMTDEEFLTLCSKLYEIRQEAIKSAETRQKMSDALKILDTLSVTWPEAKEQAAECIIQMENIPTYSEYISQEISKLPNMIEIKENIKK